MKKGLQVLVCLILCLSLVVCMSPIRAHAIAVEAEIAIGVFEVAAAVLMGLGLMPHSDAPEVFSSLTSKLVSAWETAGLVTGGLVSLLNPGLNSYYVQKDLLDWTKDWLFSDRVVYDEYTEGINGFTYSTPLFRYGNSTIGGNYTVVESQAPVYFGSSYFHSGSSTVVYSIIAYSTAPFTLKFGSSYLYGSAGWTKDHEGKSVYLYSTFVSNSFSGIYDYNCVYGSSFDFVKFACTSSAASSYVYPVDIHLGQVLPSSDKSVEETYTDWADSIIEVTYEPEGRPDPGPVPYIPLWSPQFEDPEAPLDDVTQEDVWTKGIYEAITDPETGIAGNVSGIHSIVGAISGTLKEMYEWLKGKWTSLFDWLAQILAAIQSLDVKQILLDIWDGIKGIPQLLSDLWQTVKDILAFLKTLVVPESDYLTDKLNALKDKFGFVRSIFETGAAIRSSLLSGDPPVVYVHLENAEGHYNYGGTVPILDMHFYSRYKPAGDMIISSFMWLFFIWRVIYGIPDFIAGVGGNVIFSPAAEETHSLVVVPRKKDD